MEDKIKDIMRGVLLVPKDGGYRPAKNTSKEDCYMALGKIQELLGTNRIEMEND